MSTKNYYDVLGVSKDSDDAEIKKAYRKLAMQHHPDRNKDDASSEKKFKEVGEAYETLKDDQKRSAYDRCGHDAFVNSGGNSAGGGQRTASGGGGFEDMSDIFGDIFGDFMNRGASQGRRNTEHVNRGSDLRKDISITLEDSYNGLKQDIKYYSPQLCKTCDGSGSKSNKTSRCSPCGGSGRMRMQQGFFVVEQTCSNCNGSGQTISDPCNDCSGEGRASKEKSIVVDIPQGIQDGTRMRISGAGECGYRGGSSGDLYIFISVKEHKFFKRESNNLHCEVPIRITQAILGDTIEVPLIGGKISVVKVPPGTSHNKQLRLSGKGMPLVKSGGRMGDMIISIKVEIPSKITKRQRELLVEFDEENKAGNNPESDGFMSRVKNIFGN